MQTVIDKRPLLRPGEKKWKFSEILKDSVIRERFDKVRQYFFLRESTYDMSNRCNIRCEGCYYYEGEKQFASESGNVEEWKRLMEAEKARGITFIVLAGAEPSLVPDLLQVCYEVIPLGAIATNGFKRIPESVGLSLHLSVWGNDETSMRIRKAKNLLEKQIDNYRGDDRAIWVYTFCRENIQEAYEVTEILAKNDCKITFNVFSTPVGQVSDLAHTPESLMQMRTAMMELLQQYPETVVFSPYNAVAHTHKFGLHELYGCPYPRMNPSEDIGLGRSFRQYRTDLTWDRNASCCVPDTDCADCRHYAAGSAVVTSKLHRHAINPETFRSWLDYVDTYLAVWVLEYEKSKNLCPELVPPPGFSLDGNWQE